MTRNKVCVPVIAALICASCASIPREAPELSSQLGARIQETRVSHKNLFRTYMDLKRATIDDFVDREWVPVFAKNVFKEPAVAAEWERIVRSNDAVERTEFIRGMGQRISEKIEAKRRELRVPLDEAELAIMRQLEEHYDQMHAMNLTLTRLLEENAEASQTQARILGVVDPQGKFQGLVDKVDEVVDLMVKNRDAFEENRQRIETLIEELKAGTGTKQPNVHVTEAAERE